MSEADHSTRVMVSLLCRGRRRRGHIPRRRPGEQLAGYDDDHGEEHAQADEASRKSDVGDEVFREGRDVNRRPAVATDDQANDEAALVGPEPSDRRRSGRSISKAHANAAQDAKAEDQSGIALHQPSQDAAPGQRKAAQSGSNLRSVPVLDCPARNHEQGENAPTRGVRPGCLGIGQVQPALVQPGHGRASRMGTAGDEVGFPDAPGVEDSQAEVDRRARECHYPGLRRNW